MANHSTFVSLHFPHGGWSLGDQDNEQSTAGRVLVQMLLGDLMLLLIRSAINNGNSLNLRVSADATAKTSSHPHEMRVVQLFLRTIVQPSPPGPKTAR